MEQIFGRLSLQPTWLEECIRLRSHVKETVIDKIEVKLMGQHQDHKIRLDEAKMRLSTSL